MYIPSVAVVILNFNGKDFLEKFLPSVLENSQSHSIYVADNGSNDDSVSYLKTYFPQVKLIEIEINCGFAKGYNTALKQITTDYYVLLNSDVEATQNWIAPIINLMQSDEKIAACQPKLLDFKNKNFFEYAGASGGYIDKYGYPFCRGRIFNSLEKDVNQYDDTREIFWATGACLFVKAKAFWEVNGLDDDYFAHMEEIDLCWRLKNVGYSIFVEPKSIVYHVGGGTLNKISSRKTFLNFRNNLITLTKNDSSNFLFFKLIYRLKLDAIAAFKFLVDGQPKHFFAVIRAHFAYYSELPKTLSKRKKLKQQPTFKFNKSSIYNGNIVFDYFLKKKKKFSDLEKSNFFSN
ncbi:MAG: glycosyltransferase family 2 protein [Bacteroidota bacterium]|nr:glycosyltransferase family 2 protein [Bacteroidota bacterium]MDP3145554.1 glycosyltransferase family 2 protein [Bacteroidota bacterium]